MPYSHSILQKKLQKNWPLFLLALLLLILGLHKYLFPMVPFYPQTTQKPRITLYSNPTYYSAVLPWLSLSQRQNKFFLDHKIWMNINHLQFHIRHQQGEFWITSLEGAVQARQRGADLKILMVMGWKRWNLLSTRPEDHLWSDEENIIYYPLHSSSARNVLKKCLPTEHYDIEFQPMELPRLMNKLQNGQIQTALLQTPLSTYLQDSRREFITNIPIEKLFVEKQGRMVRFPWIVLAVRSKWALQNLELVEYIQKRLRRESYMLNLMPVQEISKLWSSLYQSDISPNMLESLLKNEKLQSIPAAEAEEQIRLLLKYSSPYIKYGPDLLWKYQSQHSLKQK